MVTLVTPIMKNPSERRFRPGLDSHLRGLDIWFVVCRPAEDRTWLRDGKAEDCHDDQYAFQSDKQPLVMYQRPTVPITQLVDTVNTSRQYQNDGQTQESDEDFESLTHLLFLDLTGCFGVADSVVDGEGDEDAEGEDLEGEAGEGDIDRDVGLAGGDRGEGAAAGLEDEGEDVAGDEEPVVEPGREAGVGGAEVDDSIP